MFGLIHLGNRVVVFTFTRGIYLRMRSTDALHGSVLSDLDIFTTKPPKLAREDF